MKYEVFDRLNTGGVTAKPMEVRNAVFPGPFKEALHEFSENSNFRSLWGIPTTGQQIDLEKNSTYRDMSDLELVLRFFALRKATLDGTRYKDFLSEYMSDRNKEYKNNPAIKDQDRAMFEQAVANVFTVFGASAFRPPLADKRSLRSAPFADAVMQSLADVDPALLHKESVREEIKASFEKLIESGTFIASISSGTNGESAIRNRITLARAAVQQVLEG